MAQGFWINNDGCYGCKTCSMACITTKVPGNHTTFMRRVTDILIDQPQAYSFLSMSCNHCESPACVANCPVAAYTKRDDGVVVQDHELCIGCQTCINACPYSAPAYNEAEGKTHKCDMCIDRQERGQKPACVEACPGANLAVGEMDALQSTYDADFTSDADVETAPNIVVSADPRLTGNPAQYGLAETR